jgi:hypothetical protein
MARRHYAPVRREEATAHFRQFRLPPFLIASGEDQRRRWMGRAVRRRSSSAVQSVPDFEIKMVNGIGLAAFGAAQLGEAEADLAQGRQVRRQAAGAQALPDGASQALLGGPPRPVIESLQTAAAG